MNRKEYWNVSNTTKKYMVKYIPYLFLYFAASCIFYLLDPEDLRWPVVASALGVLWFLGLANASRKMTTRPYCSFTDESVVLDYDQNFIPWSTVAHVAVNNEKKEAKIWQSTARNPVFKKISKNYSHIDGRWAQDWNSFVKDLEAECNKRSVGYTIEDEKQETTLGTS